MNNTFFLYETRQGVHGESTTPHEVAHGLAEFCRERWAGVGKSAEDVVKINATLSNVVNGRSKQAVIDGSVWKTTAPSPDFWKEWEAKWETWDERALASRRG